ncbi:MAG: radical SAM protein [Christensenellales bacterium]|jgi:radical SAM superfamily enzyme YgiQ (UPF0313 family)
MRYEGRIFRPPSEARSLIVQATIGCSHNRCTFCDMYKEKRFRLRDVEDVLQDLRTAAEHYASVRRIFLADGDALIMKAADLERILLCIRQHYPNCERVGIYGSPRSIQLKSPEELRLLFGLGLGIVYLGLESGSDKILQRVNKGETADQIVEAGKKVMQAGLLVSVTAISGLGGKGDWREHAMETARAFTEMKPNYIGLLTLMLEGDIPLLKEYQEGRFELLSPQEVAMETYLMLENMDCEGSVFRSNHASNYLSLAGTLNGDKADMLGKLRGALQGEVAFKEEFFRLL